MSETDNRKLEVPPFQDGLVINRTEHFRVEYGRKPGVKGKGGERVLIVATDREAEGLLKDFARENANQVQGVPFGEEGKETIAAIRLAGEPQFILSMLKSEKGQEGMPGVGGGIPSLTKLEAQLAQK